VGVAIFFGVMMALEKKLTYKDGFKLGIPICLGYFSVSLAFGLMAMNGGLPLWAPLLTSLTNFTGTGQFAGINLLLSGASIAEISFTVLMINIRYFLLSMSVSQKLPKEIGLGKRLLMAFGMTDENFAVIYAQSKMLTFPFCIGVMTSSYIGWFGGTLAGAVLNNIIPVMLTAALGIMIYAMFVAIVTPSAKESRAVLGVVVIAVAISCLFRYTPYLNKLSKGWVYVIAGLVSAVVMALIKPYKDENDQQNNSEDMPNQSLEKDETEQNACAIEDSNENKLHEGGGAC